MVSQGSATQDYYFGIKVTSGHFFHLLRGFLSDLNVHFCPMSICNFQPPCEKREGIYYTRDKRMKVLIFTHGFTGELCSKSLHSPEKDIEYFL